VDDAELHPPSAHSSSRRSLVWWFWVAAVTVLLDGNESVPLGLRRRLADGLSDPKLDVLLLGDPSVLDLLNLRLREAFGRLKAADAIVTLLGTPTTAGHSCECRLRTQLANSQLARPSR